MKKQEILDYNNRCAEFLGYVNTTPTDKDFNIYENKDGKMLETMSMLFHSDWNWIMEVVEAIAKIPNKHKEGIYKNLVYLDLNPITGVAIEGMYSKNFRDKDDFQKITFYEEDFKTNAVQAINQFLIWYYENNK